MLKKLFLLLVIIGFSRLSAQEIKTLYNSKKVAVSKDTIEIEKVSISPSFFKLQTSEGKEIDTSYYKIDFKKGISEIHKHNDAFVVVNVKDVLPQEQKTLEEAKGTVISDYQNYKEENWLKDLRGKYNVEVNQDVLEKVKSQLKK